MEFQVGDLVKINKQATIEDLTKNHWNGCQSNTLEFLKKYVDKDKTFEVVSNYEDFLNIKEIGSNYLIELVNSNILKKIQVKEMTVSEIEKELGYPIKIIKED